MIRKATEQDIGHLLLLCKKAHGKSDWARFTWNQQDSAIFLLQSMRARDMCCIVSENNGKLDGVIVGVENPMPFNQRVFTATDIFTFSLKRGVADDLVKAFLHWALAQRKADEVVMMCSQIRSEKWFGSILERNGMTPVGRGYVRQSCQKQ